MHEPPDDVADDEVLSALGDLWAGTVDRVEHLPVGFGAHHWAAYAGTQPRFFVTLDHLSHGTHHDAQSLDATYVAAASLGETLPFVVSCLPASTGALTVPFGDGALSVTGWVDGRRPVDAAGAVPSVRALHAAPPPRGIVAWAPLVPETFAADLARRLDAPWDAGPLGHAARSALVEHLPTVETWTADYHRLADVAHDRAWVPTHGEPHERNQLVTSAGLRLVDWESLRLAPAERDLRWLPTRTADPEMVRLFDLEWRLDEIGQYASWFEHPHGDGDDDREALAGLIETLA